MISGKTWSLLERTLLENFTKYADCAQGQRPRRGILNKGVTQLDLKRWKASENEGGGGMEMNTEWHPWGLYVQWHSNGVGGTSRDWGVGLSIKTYSHSVPSDQYGCSTTKDLRNWWGYLIFHVKDHVKKKEESRLELNFSTWYTLRQQIHEASAM